MLTDEQIIEAYREYERRHSAQYKGHDTRPDMNADRNIIGISRAIEQAATLAEREACIEACESEQRGFTEHKAHNAAYGAFSCVQTIRALKDQK